MKFEMSKLSTRLLASAFSLAVLAGTTYPAFAEHDGTAPKKCTKEKWEEHRKEHKEVVETFHKDLNLTEAQKEQIKTIRKNFKEAHKADFEAMKAQHKEIKELKAKGTDEATLKARREAMKNQFAGLDADRTKMQAEIRTLLTPEQAAKWDKFHQEHSWKKRHNKKPNV